MNLLLLKLTNVKNTSNENNMDELTIIKIDECKNTSNENNMDELTIIKIDDNKNNSNENTMDELTIIKIDDNKSTSNENTTDELTIIKIDESKNASNENAMEEHTIIKIDDNINTSNENTMDELTIIKIDDNKNTSNENTMDELTIIKIDESKNTSNESTMDELTIIKIDESKNSSLKTDNRDAEHKGIETQLSSKSESKFHSTTTNSENIPKEHKLRNNNASMLSTSVTNPVHLVEDVHEIKGNHSGHIPLNSLNTTSPIIVGLENIPSSGMNYLTDQKDRTVNEESLRGGNVSLQDVSTCETALVDDNDDIDFVAEPVGKDNIEYFSTSVADKSKVCTFFIYVINMYILKQPQP